MSNDIKETLKEMARLTVLSNRINEIQEKNLKVYPFIFFDAVKKVDISYDLSHYKANEADGEQSNSIVSYYIELDELANDSLEKRFVAIESAVRNLFWSDVLVEVYFNDKIVFKSKSHGR